MRELHRVLFVDDDPDILTIARYCFADFDGIEVRYSNSGEEAVKESVEFQPDLIILDVMMPHMDGPATLKAIKFITKGSNLPVAFITSKLRSHDLQHYQDLGVIDVIHKPFDPNLLKETVLSIWQKHNA